MATAEDELVSRKQIAGVLNTSVWTEVPLKDAIDILEPDFEIIDAYSYLRYFGCLCALSMHIKLLNSVHAKRNVFTLKQEYIPISFLILPVVKAGTGESEKAEIWISDDGNWTQSSWDITDANEVWFSNFYFRKVSDG